MFSRHGYIDCIHPPPHISLTAEKAKEILREVEETQETFKKQQEKIKLEAEVCMYMYISQLCACNCVLCSELSYSRKFSLCVNFRDFCGQTCFCENIYHEKWTKVELIMSFCAYVEYLCEQDGCLQSVCPLNGCCKEESASYCTNTNEPVRDAPKMSHQPVRASHIPWK